MRAKPLGGRFHTAYAVPNETLANVSAYCSNKLCAPCVCEFREVQWIVVRMANNAPLGQGFAHFLLVIG
jgi:hypothetical protein